jgi:nucleoid DNA-binding protein
MGLGALLGLMGVLLTLSAFAQTPRKGSGTGAETGRQPLEKLVARASKVGEEDVLSVLRALGPAVRDRLRGGEAITLPGLGVFRIVRVEEHKDLVKGIPTVVPAANYVEFLPASEMSAAASAPGTTPAVVVPPSEFIVDPRHEPSSKSEYLRTPRSRAGH